MSQPIFNITTPGFTPDMPTTGGGPGFSRPYTTDLTPQDIISLSTRSGEPKKKGFSHNLKEYGKGLFNGAWNTVTSLLSLKGLAFALGTAGLVWMTGGMALPFMAAAGLGLGTIQTLKGALSGNWEQAGEGSFALGASMLGMKGISKTPKWMSPWKNVGKEQTAKFSGAVDSVASTAKASGNQVFSNIQSMINSGKEQFGKLLSMVTGKTTATAEEVAGAAPKAKAPTVATENQPAQIQDKPPQTNEAPTPDVAGTNPNPVQPQANGTTSEKLQDAVPDAKGANPAQPQTVEPPAPPAATTNTEGAAITKNGVSELPKPANATQGTVPAQPQEVDPKTAMTQAFGSTPANDNQTEVASGSAKSNWGKCKEQTNQFFKNDKVSGHIYSGTIPNSFSGISNSGQDN